MYSLIEPASHRLEKKKNDITCSDDKCFTTACSEAENSERRQWKIKKSHTTQLASKF